MDDSLSRKRRRDPEASRQALLDAALDEISEHGLAGARTGTIAKRAGLNKQLISHHFGGKEGLYRALIDRWLAEEEGFDAEGMPLAGLVQNYVEDAHRHRRLHKLLLRASLDGSDDVPGLSQDDLDAMRRRRQAGEISDRLDPGFILLLLQAAVAAGIVFPADVTRLTGLDPASAEFVAWQSEQLGRLLDLLSG